MSARRDNNSIGRRSADRIWSIVIGWGALCVALAIPCPARSADPPARLKKIFVPADSPSQWPQGDWVPISARELEALQEKFRPIVPEPDPVVVSRAEYSAVLAGSVFRNGALTAEIQKLGEGDRYVSLDPLNLPLSNLKWSDDEAIWGSDLTGNTRLLVDRTKGQLNGAWSLNGVTFSQLTEFQFHLIPAITSTIHLKIPNELSVNSADGQVHGPVASGERGWSDWTIDLGTKSSCRITVKRKPESQTARPIVFYEQETSCVAREADMEFRTDFHVDVLDSPIKDLRFSLPADCTIDSITYGGEIPLAWRNAKNSAKKKNDIVVQLTDPLLGKGRTVRIRGRSSLVLDRNAPVPQVSLNNAYFHTGTFAFRVARPLQLKEFVQESGFKQVTTAIDDTAGHTVTFEQFKNRPKLTTRIGYPNRSLSAEVLSLVDASTKQWRLNSEVQWHALSGSTFVGKCRLPLDWEVTDILPGDDQVNIAHWSVSTQNLTNERIISIEFRDALRPGTPNSVRIFARRDEDFTNRPTEFPTVTPIDCDRLRTGLILRHSPRAAVRIELGQDELVAESLQNLKESWKDSPIWDDVARGDVTTSAFSSTSLALRGRIRLQTTEQPLRVRANVELAGEPGQLIETFLLDCTPVKAPLERLHVFLSRPGSPPNWSFAEETGIEIQSVRMPVAQHQEWALPQFGELWELRFSKPIRQQMLIRGERESELIINGTATVVFVPAAVTFDGTISISPTKLSEVEAHSVDMQPDQSSTASTRNDAATLGGLLTHWRYQSPLQKLRLVLHSEELESERQKIATALLRTWFGNTTKSFDLHWLTVRVEESSAGGPFRFELPRQAELISVQVDGVSVIASQQEDAYFIPPLPQSSSHEFIIHYRVPATNGFLESRRRVVLPRIAQVVLEFDWEFSLEETCRLLDVPDSVILLDSNSSSDWRTLVFGAWAGDPHRFIFNPFSKKSWNELSWVASQGQFDKEEDFSSGRFPPRANIFRAQAIHLPESIEVTIANRHPIRATAWFMFWTTGLIGLALRLTRLRYREQIGIIFLAGVTFLLFVLPTALAEIAGNCLLAGLLTAVLPEKCLAIFRGASGRDTDAMLGSTISMHSFVGSSLLILLSLFSSTLFGQERDLEKSLSATDKSPVVPKSDDSWRLLIPVSDASKPSNTLPELVYVERSYLKTLYQGDHAASESAFEYLITSIEYSADIEEQATSAEFFAHIDGIALADAKTVPVFLGFRNPNFGGPQVCRVNDMDHPVLLDGEKNAYYVEVPGGQKKRFTIDLTMFPAQQSLPGAGSIHLNVPLVLSSRVELNFSSKPVKVDLPEATGSVTLSTTNDTLTAELGRTDTLSVTWFGDSRPAQPTQFYNAKVLCLVEVHPSYLQLNYRIFYEGLQGQTGLVYWKLPRNAVVRNVKSVRELSYHQSRDRAGNTQLAIQFLDETDTDFSIDATVTLPLSSASPSVRIPSIDPIRGVTRSAESTSVATTVGIAASPGFQIEPSFDELGDVRSISPERFLLSWQDVESLRRPQLAFQLQSPSPLTFTLKQLEPTRSARFVQAATVGQRRLEWNAVVEMEVGDVPAFQHVLSIDPRLAIESISVSEDDAERLAQWSRQADRVLLFLNGKTTGIQTISIKAHMPIRGTEWFKLPTVHVENAKLTDSTLVVVEEKGTRLQFDEPDKLRKLESDDATTMPTGTSSPNVQRYRFASNDDPPQIRVTPSSSESSLSAARFLIRLPNRRWKTQAVLRMGGNAASNAKPLQIRIPEELTKELRISSERGELPYATQADGFTLVEIPGRWAGETVTLEATVSPAAAESWKLPQLFVDDQPILDQYLILAQADRLHIENSDAYLEGTQNLAAWIKQALTHLPAGESARVFQRPTSQNESWLVSGFAGSQPKIQAGIPLAETRLWLENNTTLFGKTNILIYGTDDTKLNIAWPRDTHLLAALLNGNPISGLKPTNNALSIALHSGVPVHTVTILWKRQNPIPKNEWVAPQEFDIPQPTNLRPDRMLITIVTGMNTKVTAHDGWRRMTNKERQLDFLDAYLAVNRRSFNVAGTMHLNTWENVAGLSRALDIHQPENDVELATDKLSIRAERIGRELDELRAASNQLAPSPISTVESTPGLQRRLLGEVNPEILQQVFGRIRTTDSPMVSFLIINQQLVRLGLGLGALVLILCGFALIPTTSFISWIQTHSAASVGLIGLFFWLFLAPSILGLCLILGACTAAVIERLQPHDDSENEAILDFIQ